MSLIKVRYKFTMANILYMKQRYEDSGNYAREALDICNDDKNISYETLNEMKKHKKEIENLILKCRAKSLNKSALDLQPIQGMESEAKS